eukprot:TRINITY_DN13264_c0_g1_i1.p1 TRINITY_DN13264_c0_g1~~TRINITY_DN13264_c0_g1_i1.p1  ORF type:complete len:808 (-),score=112.57 TRINITY_DN13264_c0_g1_i1:772-3195(-)
MAYPNQQYGAYYGQTPQQAYGQPLYGSPQPQYYAGQPIYAPQQPQMQQVVYQPQYGGAQPQYQQLQAAPAPTAHYGTIPPANSPVTYPHSPQLQYSQGNYNGAYVATQSPQPIQSHYGTMPPVQQPQQQYMQPQQAQYPPQSNYGAIPPAGVPQQNPAPGVNYGSMPPVNQQQGMPPRTNSGQLLSAPPQSAHQVYGSMPPPNQPMQGQPGPYNQPTYIQQQPLPQPSGPPNSNYGEIPRSASSTLLSAPPKVAVLPHGELHRVGSSSNILSGPPSSAASPAVGPPQSNYGEVPQRNSAPQLVPLNQKPPETTQYGEMPPIASAASAKSPALLASHPSAARIVLAAPTPSPGSPRHTPSAPPETQQYGALPPVKSDSKPAFDPKASAPSNPSTPPATEHYGALPPRPASPVRPSVVEPPSATYGALPAMKSDWTPNASSSINPASLVQTQMTEKDSPFANRSFDAPTSQASQPKLPQKPLTHDDDDDGAFPAGPPETTPSTSSTSSSTFVPPERAGSLKSVPSLTIPVPARPSASGDSSPRSQSPSPSTSPRPGGRPVPPVPERPSSGKLNPLNPYAGAVPHSGEFNYGEIPPPDASDDFVKPAPVVRAATSANLGIRAQPDRPAPMGALPPRAVTKISLPVVPPKVPPKRKSSADMVPSSSTFSSSAPETQHYASFGPPSPKRPPTHDPSSSSSSTYGALPPIPLPGAVKALPVPVAKHGAPPRPKGPPPGAMLDSNIQQIVANQRKHKSEVADDLNRQLEQRPTPNELRERKILPSDAYLEARFSQPVIGDAAFKALGSPRHHDK